MLSSTSQWGNMSGMFLVLLPPLLFISSSGDADGFQCPDCPKLDYESFREAGWFIALRAIIQ